MGLPKSAAERVAVTRRAMTVGAAAGVTELVAPEPRPLPPPFTSPPGTPTPWTMSPVDISEFCPVHEVEEGGTLGIWRVNAKPASGDDIVIDAYLNDDVIDTFTLVAGITKADWDLSAFFCELDDELHIMITSATPDCALRVQPAVR